MDGPSMIQLTEAEHKDLLKMKAVAEYFLHNPGTRVDHFAVGSKSEFRISNPEKVLSTWEPTPLEAVEAAWGEEANG